MTTDRTYRCNLCRDLIDEQSGRGVFFLSDRRGPAFEFAPVRDVEHHICNRCVAAVLVHARPIPAPKGE